MKPYSLSSAPLTFNALIYGYPGSGKTTLAATASEHPALTRVLFMNVEGGLLSIRNKKGVDAVDIRNLADMESLFWDLSNPNGQFAEYQTLVLDSASELASMDLEKLAMTHSKQGEGLREIHIGDYSKNTTAMRRLVRMFRDLPRNFIMTSLVKEIFPDGSNTLPIRFEPLFTAKLNASIMGMVDFLWYLRRDVIENPDGTKSEVGRLLTRPTTKYAIKTRGESFSQILKPVVENPNIAEIYDLLLSSEHNMEALKGGDVVSDEDQ
jgi:hypothetical protein